MNLYISEICFLDLLAKLKSLNRFVVCPIVFTFNLSKKNFVIVNKDCV